MVFAYLWRDLNCLYIYIYIYIYYLAGDEARVNHHWSGWHIHIYTHYALSYCNGIHISTRRLDLPLYLCIYVSIYLSINLSIYIYIDMYIYIYIYIYIYTHTHTHTYIYIYIYIYVCMYVYIYIYLYIYMCIWMYLTGDEARVNHHWAEEVCVVAETLAVDGVAVQRLYHQVPTKQIKEKWGWRLGRSNHFWWVFWALMQR